ncbi:hypothetical protein LEN26_017691 [Aphanomyces euteiches]|nr:hypothetical protein LEN26_017691 [Aphanomyces euteiches]
MATWQPQNIGGRGGRGGTNNRGRGKSNNRGGRNNGRGNQSKNCYVCGPGDHYTQACPLVIETKNRKNGTAAAATGQQTQIASSMVAAATEITQNQLPTQLRTTFGGFANMIYADHKLVAPDSPYPIIAQAHQGNEQWTDESLKWILDSGCSHHLVTDPSFLINPRPSDLRIRVANNESADATLVGSVKLDLRDTNSYLVLTEAHYVPGLSTNLVSVPALDDKGIKITFGEQSYSSLNWTALPIRLINQKPCPPQVYILSINQTERSMNGTFLPEEMVVRRQEHDLKIHCLECAIGKQPRSKQPTRDTSTSAPTDEIGGVISSDVAGKITRTDRYGNKYFVNYVDHASGFTMTYPMKKKSEQAARAMEFLASGPNTRHKMHLNVFLVACVATRGEYLSEKFKSFLVKRGIRHALTERNTSGSNGKEERMHRTLSNATRTMLFACDLPAKCLVTCTCIRILPQKAFSKQGKC